MWQTITGKVEPNEHALDAAKRELAEETGLYSAVWYKVPFLGGFYDMKRNSVESVPAFAVVFDDMVDVRLSEEHSQYKWIGADELESVFFIPDHVNGALQFEKLIKSPEQQRIFAV
jgi:dATP pyrophosphohydrolase